MRLDSSTVLGSRVVCTNQATRPSIPATEPAERRFIRALIYGRPDIL